MTPADITDGKLYIRDSASFFGLGPRGGWGSEYFPLTANWGIEWTMKITDTSIVSQDYFTIFLGKNWVYGGDPTATKYQVSLKWEHYVTTSGDTTDHHFVASMWLDDKDSGIDVERKVAFDMVNTGTYYATHNWRVKCINDNTFVLWMDGIVRWVYTIPASLEGGGFLRGPGLRAQAMRSAFCDTEIENWFVYDYVGTAPVWSSDVFYDNFNRSNGAPGNGWTTVGSDVVINSNSLGLAGGLLSDGNRGAWRSGAPLSTGNMRLSVTLGGAHGLSNAQDSSVIGRMNSTGTLGIALNIFGNKIYIAKFTGTLSSPTFTDLGMDALTLNNGDVLDYVITGDEAWVEYAGQVLLYVDGINAHSAESNRGYGVRFKRGAFVNSVAFNDFRVQVKV
ncbi:hypothetical protein [Nocardia salmonicida]|uniref:hypothetical protein n=1 Tax=Nocardia salmonicida TaxID=53431 RepID=UPI002E2C9B75|nr:hypothetical protein [Nocardia salmonicida]